MKMKGTIVIAAAVLAAILAFSAPARADDVSREGTQADQMMHKLGRGLVNTFTGFVEIPKNMAKEWRKSDPFTDLVVGSIKGVGWAWTRTMTGVYEVLTFPFPVPEGYVPMMDPEFVLTDIWGDTLATLAAPADGMIFGLRALPNVQTGDWCCFFHKVEGTRD